MIWGCLTVGPGPNALGSPWRLTPTTFLPGRQLIGTWQPETYPGRLGLPLSSFDYLIGDEVKTILVAL